MVPPYRAIFTNANDNRMAPVAAAA